MSIIGKAASLWQTALGPALDELGRQTGVIQRQRKFAGASLLKMMVLTFVRSPNAKTDRFVATAAQLGLTVTTRAVEQRFTDKLVAFLRAGLEHVSGHALAADPVAIPLLDRFTVVEIADSTSLTVPDDYRDEFPGCGGKSGSGQAAVKLQVARDLRSGALTKLEIQPGRHSDATSEAPDHPVTPGSSSIRDLGYFSLERFRRLGTAGAYWISRRQQGTAVFDADGRPLDLLGCARRHQGVGPIDRPILLGAQERLPCRLIVLRVPREVAARRRQKAYERARKHGTAPGAEQLAWCEWTAFGTNCPQELLSWKEVVVLYRGRWHAEISHRHSPSRRSLSRAA